MTCGLAVTGAIPCSSGGLIVSGFSAVPAKGFYSTKKVFLKKPSAAFLKCDRRLLNFLLNLTFSLIVLKYQRRLLQN